MAFNLGSLVVNVRLSTAGLAAQVAAATAPLAAAGAKLGAAFSLGFNTVVRSRAAFTALGVSSRNLALEMGRLRTDVALLTIAFGFAIKAAIDIEAGFFQVRKTTGLTGQAFQDLAEGLGLLSIKLAGIKLGELQRIATVAGQLGIRGRQNILSFTQAIVKLSATSDLEAESAANKLARIMNVFQLDIGETGRVATVFTRLAAETNAIESEIAELTRRMSGAAVTIGLTVDETAALAAALKQAGVNAEVGGTAFTQVLLGMLQRTEEFAAGAGMSFEDFAKLVDTKPIEALRALLTNLSELDKRSRVAVLKDLKIDGVRAAGTILQLSSNVKEFDRALALSRDEFEKQTALQKEFQNVSATTRAQLIRAGNAALLLAKSVGDDLLPEVRRLTTLFVTVWAPAIGDFISENGRAIAVTIKWTLAFLALSFIIPRVTAAMRLLAASIALVNKAFLALIAKNPLVAILIVAVLGLAAAWDAVANSANEAGEAMDRNITKWMRFKEIALGILPIDQKFRRNAEQDIVSKGSGVPGLESRFTRLRSSVLDSFIAGDEALAKQKLAQLEKVATDAFILSDRLTDIGDQQDISRGLKTENPGRLKPFKPLSEQEQGLFTTPGRISAAGAVGSKLFDFVEKIDRFVASIKGVLQIGGTSKQDQILEDLLNKQAEAGRDNKPAFLGLKDAFDKTQLAILEGADVEKQHLQTSKDLLTEAKESNSHLSKLTRGGNTIPIAG